MREIGTIVEEKEARTLADFLLTLGISTKLVARAKGDGWVIWVHREDRLDEARKVFDEYQANPADPLYHTAAPTAKAIRKEAERKEADYRKRVRDVTERWSGQFYQRAPLTFGLIVASVAVVILQKFYWPTFDILAFSLEFDVEGKRRDGQFDEILSGEVWRLVTPIFLHFGLLHLVLNMVAMRNLGERVELRKGTWRMVVIVLVSAIAGNVAQSFKSGGGFGGMSGVVFALSSYLWIKGHVHPEDGLGLTQRGTNFMIGWFLMGIVAGEMATPQNREMFPFNMANIAHGVGLVVGMIFGLMKF